MRPLRLIALAAALLPSILLRAQNFDYSFTHSTSSYLPLNGAIVLDNGNDWNNKQYKVPIGFGFEYMGQTFDSLRIETNGFLVFDDNKRYAFTAFKGMQCKKDSNNVFSTLSYQLTGTAGSRILKIEYKNCGLYPKSIQELFSYQIWLYEQTGKIEVHTGTHNYSTIPNIYKPMIGLISMNHDTGNYALLLNGNPGLPTAQILSNNSNLVSLDAIPSQGTIYTFTPNN